MTWMEWAVGHFETATNEQIIEMFEHYSIDPDEEIEE